MEDADRQAVYGRGHGYGPSAHAQSSPLPNMLLLREDLHSAWGEYEFGVDPDVRTHDALTSTSPREAVLTYIRFGRTATASPRSYRGTTPSPGGSCGWTTSWTRRRARWTSC